MLSLDAMLNEYISLKEQKVTMDQERVQLEQERWRIQTLLQGMQDAMNAYNACAGPLTPAIQGPPVANLAVAHPPSNPSSGSPSGTKPSPF